MSEKQKRVAIDIGLLEEHAPTAHAEIFSPDFCYRECLLAPDEAAAIKMARAAQVLDRLPSGTLVLPGAVSCACLRSGPCSVACGGSH